MAVRKCPICGSDVIGDTCFTCGFEMKNEDEITVGYIPEPRQSDSYPGAQSGYSNAQYSNSAANSGGYETAPHAVGGGFTEAPNTRVKYAENYSDAPRVEVVYPNNKGNYVPPQSDFDMFCEHIANMTFSEKLEKYWWVVLISLFLPAALTIIPAIILMIFKNKSVRKLGQNLLVLGIISMFVFA
jgi:hypothetical protein